MLYTGYYSKHKHYLENDLKCVSISVSSPIAIDKWYAVVPSKDLLYRYKNGELSPEQYTSEYKKMLDNNKNKIAKDLEYYIQRDTIFLCYEGIGKFCHRHVLAEYIRDTFNLECCEF